MDEIEENKFWQSSGPHPDGEIHHFAFNNYSEMEGFIAGIEWVNDSATELIDINKKEYELSIIDKS